MNRLLKEHTKGLFVISLFWIGAGIYIYQNPNSVYSKLYYYFGPQITLQTQNFHKTYLLLKKAENYVKSNQVDLKIMQKSCQQMPHPYKGELKEFAPHWLEKLEYWNLQTQDTKTGARKFNVASYPDYWKKKYKYVSLSMQYALEASRYGYEIPLKIVAPELHKKETLLVAKAVDLYARAMCQDVLGLLTWLDYTEFLERTNSKKELSYSPFYKEALLNSLGTFFEPLSNNNELDHLCDGKRLNLSCLEPMGAIRLLNKSIRISNTQQAGRYHLQLGYTYFIAYQREGFSKHFNERKNELLKQAIHNFAEASKEYEFDLEARSALAEIHLREKKYSEALNEVRYMNTMRRQPGFSNERFINLAKRGLIGAGRIKALDCISKYSTQPINSGKLNCFL